MLIEIGPGRGDFLFWLAAQNPKEEVVGIEYKKKRYEKLIRRLEKNGLTNVRLMNGDAREILPKIPTAAARELYILFSDPWPKKRHARRRLFQEGLIEELFRIIRPGGRVVIATDDPRYKEEILQLFRLYPSFVYVADVLNFPTFYAQKWQAEGRTLHSFSYRKDPDVLPTVEST